MKNPSLDFYKTREWGRDFWGVCGQRIFFKLYIQVRYYGVIPLLNKELTLFSITTL